MGTRIIRGLHGENRYWGAGSSCQSRYLSKNVFAEPLPLLTGMCVKDGTEVEFYCPIVNCDFQYSTIGM